MEGQSDMTQCDGWRGGWHDGWRRSPANGLFWGLLLVIGGGMFLLRNLGMLDFDMRAFWPVIPIAVGISHLVTRPHPFAITSGMVLTSLGVVLLLRSLQILSFGTGAVIWPVILIAVGGSMLLRRALGHKSGL